MGRGIIYDTESFGILRKLKLSQTKMDKIMARYYLEDIKKRKLIEEMKLLSIEELRLWVIQELSCPDSECWWLVDIGINILKGKMKKSK